MTWLLSLVAASPESDLGAWVPSTILAAGCLALLTFVGKIMLGRLDKIEGAQAVTNEVLKRLTDFATKEALSSMGNRFDERVGNLRERVAVLESKEESKE